MRLLVDCVPLREGGGVQVAIALLEGLGHRADVNWLAVLPESMQRAVPHGVRAQATRLTFVPKTSLLDMVRARLVLQKVERDFAPDVVFTVFGPAYFRAQTPHVVGFALPLLIYEPSGPLLKASGPLSTLADGVRCHLLRHADHLVVETETVRDRLARRIGYDRQRISVIGNSVNPLLLEQTPSPAPVCGRYAIIIPSVYYLHKNLDVVPPVAAALRRLDPAFDFEFRLTLDPASVPWLAIASAAQRLDVVDRVRTLGVLSLDELAASYRSASAVFLPTLREASTAVYPESFYFERPLVTSDIDFARELCGDAAIFVPPLEPEAIAGALLTLARCRDLAQRLIAAGERRLGQYPTPDEKLAQQIALMAKVSEQAKGVKENRRAGALEGPLS